MVKYVPNQSQGVDKEKNYSKPNVREHLEQKQDLEQNESARVQKHGRNKKRLKIGYVKREQSTKEKHKRLRNEYVKGRYE